MFLFPEIIVGMFSWWFHERSESESVFMKFQSLQIIFNPVFIVGLYSPWSLLSYVFPLMIMSVCVFVSVCLSGVLGAFSLDTSVEVWKILGCEIHVKTFSLCNFTQSLVVKMQYSAKGFWLTSDPGQCWWPCGVKLLACCLARALVFSAYGCHVLPTPPLESKVSALSLVCVQSYIQNYRSTILQS